MEYLTPLRIAEVTGGEYIGGDLAGGVRVTGAVSDNRDVKPGDLFVCIKGEHADGHDFAASAFAAGAACCLAERAINGATGPYVRVASTLEAIKTVGRYYRRLFDIPFIGVTGSVGKTTAKEMIAAVLSEKLNTHKTLKNHNNELGIPLTLLSLDDRHEAAVIEMGISDFGEMSRISDIVRPDICVMTNIGYAHLLELEDLNGVLRAKSEIFSFMKPDGVAIMNGDDDLLRDYDPGIKKITYGLGEHNDIRAENVVAEGTDSVSLSIVSDSGRFPARIPAFGAQLALSALAATAVGRQFGMTDEEISRGLLSYKPVEGRANIIQTGAITIIDDCYNANPTSVTSALFTLSALQIRRGAQPFRRVAILGEMIGLGDKSDQMHRDVGAFAARCGLDSLICCGDQAAHIYEGYITAGGNEPWFFLLKTELIQALPELIKKGDAVLIKASRDVKFKEILPALIEL